MKKKIISLCLVIALVATAIAGATLAYFTDVSEVNKNTFTVGDVQIKLDETNTDATPDDEDAPARDTENKYEDIYPGQELTKDPMVTILAGSEPSYVRMKVTANVTELKAAFPEFIDDGVFDLENLVDWKKTEWPCVGIKDNGDGTATYEFRYYKVTTEPTTDTALEPLFTKVTIPGDATSADLKALVGTDGKFEIIVVAEAIQEAGFADADAAWEAFDTVPEADKKG